MPYTGWKLPEHERRRLVPLIVPAYPRLVADHVTLALAEVPLPDETIGTIIGLADDGSGVQAVVVEIAGSFRRPADGGVFHITWSLAPGRRARESNDVIAGHGWAPRAPIAIILEPRFFPD